MTTWSSFETFIEGSYRHSHSEAIQSVEHLEPHSINIPSIDIPSDPIIDMHLHNPLLENATVNNGISVFDGSMDMYNSPINIYDNVGNRRACVFYDKEENKLYTWNQSGQVIPIEINEIKENHLIEENNEVKKLKEKNKGLEEYDRFNILDIRGK